MKSAPLKMLLRDIKEDIRKCKEEELSASAPNWIISFTHLNVLALVFYRVAHFFYVTNHTRLARLFYVLNSFVTKADINYESQVGPGCYLNSSVHTFIDGCCGRDVCFATHGSLWGGQLKDKSHMEVFGVNFNTNQEIVHIVSPRGSQQEKSKMSFNRGTDNRSMTWKTTWSLICSDVERFAENIKPAVKYISAYRFIKILLLPNVLAVFLYRISRYFFLKREMSIARMIWNLSVFLTGADINPNSDIGKRFLMVHSTGNTISGKLGDNCTFYIMSGVGRTAKSKDIGAGPGRPCLGDNVSVGAKAVVLGPIRIGNNCTIAPFSLILKDVPENSLAVGNPAKVRKKLNGDK